MGVENHRSLYSDFLLVRDLVPFPSRHHNGTPVVDSCWTYHWHHQTLPLMTMYKIRLANGYVQPCSI